MYVYVVSCVSDFVHVCVCVFAVVLCGGVCVGSSSSSLRPDPRSV